MSWEERGRWLDCKLEALSDWWHDLPYRLKLKKRPPKPVRVGLTMKDWEDTFKRILVQNPEYINKSFRPWKGLINDRTRR